MAELAAIARLEAGAEVTDGLFGLVVGVAGIERKGFWVKAAGQVLIGINLLNTPPVAFELAWLEWDALEYVHEVGDGLFV